MLSVIKTAIITIIISFISGVLLDTYKNLAPRIVCSMGKGIPVRLRNKKIRAYTLVVKNISNKTIHDLALNVQGHYDNLTVDDAKITRGLKFELSREDNIYYVSIPFLSKGDEFSIKLFIERDKGVYKKPFVTLRSPESFKKIESEEENGFVASLLSVPENIIGIFKGENGSSRCLFANKKTGAAILSIILFIFISVLSVQYFTNSSVKENEKTSNTQNVDISSNKSSSSKNKSSSDTIKKNTNSNNSSNEKEKSPVKDESPKSSDKEKKKQSTNAQEQSKSSNNTNGKLSLEEEKGSKTRESKSEGNDGDSKSSENEKEKASKSKNEGKDDDEPAQDKKKISPEAKENK